MTSKVHKWINTAIAVLTILIASATFYAQSAYGQQAEDPVAALQRQAAEAAQRAASETLEPNEINNIRDRRVTMGQPGLQMFVVFLSKSGQPIDYFVTDGKCVSSTKRLSETHRLVDHGNNAVVMKAPSEDGTYGSSSPYIYCWTADGKYKQWNGQYYASTAPIELTIKPLVIDLSGEVQAQQ
tara:strand:- start:96 stop:644 length:549 start_codon:yes stop_codon:yes gene_type:complete